MFNISRVLLVQASIIENTTVQVSGNWDGVLIVFLSL